MMNKISKKNKYLMVTLFLNLLIILPIFYYLMYKIFEYINASELMWFLFWTYVPFSIISNILIKIADME